MYEGKKDKKDDTLGLHSAALNGNVGLVKFALDHGAAIDSVANGYMPLQLACTSENHIAVVQYLIDRGADVNAQRWSKKHSADKSQAVAGATGSTALHVACANGCTKIVDLLLRNGANIYVKDKYGSRPIDVAAAKNHVEIVKLLETFGSMQIMLKGLQEGKNNVKDEYVSRRSVDAATTTTTINSKRERLRRPSLPSVFESQKLDIPDISTLPPPRHSINTTRPSPNELSSYNIIHQQQQDFMASDDSNDYSTMTSNSSFKEDWYSYGVVNSYEDENYLTSLERRAFGLTSPTTTPASYFGNVEELEKLPATTLISGRNSLETNRRPSLESTPLKRCSSDGGHLRTTALMNAMAANNISLQDDEQGNIIEMDDDDENTASTDDATEPLPPRPSLYDERPSLDQLKRPVMISNINTQKKSWWGGAKNGSSGRKSIDIYPTGRPFLETNQRRNSLDFRPSLDSLSQLAKKSIDGLSRKSIDADYKYDDDEYNIRNKANKAGFLSRWWSTSTTPSNSTSTTSTTTTNLTIIDKK